MSIESNTRKILKWLYEQDNEKPEEWYQGPIIQEKLELRVHELNDAVSVLDEREIITRMNWMGTSPYRFGQIRINPHGKNEFEKQIANDTGIRDVSQKLLFFSYSVKDKEIVGEVSDILVNDYSFDVFKAHDTIKVTEEWRSQIKENLDNCDGLVAYVTGHFRRSV